jgi:sulfite exporter TauE/SafE
MQETNLITIFFTGLLTGGLTCMAVQGGLLATTIAQRSHPADSPHKKKKYAKAESVKEDKVVPIIVFLIAKLVAYTILGFLLGWFGSLFQLSLPVQVLMQLFVVIFMLGTALNILEVHPIFRYFVIQPPRFLTRLVRQQSKSADMFAPAILGAFTIFIPCGTTQAMMALTIASGNPFMGAAILFSFIIGTAPLFFILGYLTTRISDDNHGRMMKTAAIAIFILALFNLNNTLSLVGLGIPLNRVNKDTVVQKNTAPTEATINIGAGGYYPDVINLKAGTKVTLNIENKDSYTCASAFTIPQLGIQKIVSVGQKEKIEFTTPSTPTQIPFMCSMGMYRGVIQVQ